MVNCLALVVNVLVTMTTAKELLTSVGELEAVKDNNGVAQCVTSPPNKTVTARSKIDCMRVCISEGCSCAYGANYHSDDKRCELHGEPPGSLEQVPSCVYYQVLTWSVYSANSTQPERCRKGSIPGQHKNHYHTILHHRPIERTLKDQACSRFAGRTTFNKKNALARRITRWVQLQAAQLSLTNRALLFCKVVEVLQDVLSENVDKKFTTQVPNYYSAFDTIILLRFNN